MQLYLMATPEQTRSLGRLRPPVAHIAYRIGDGSTLLRQNLPLKRQEGLLVISDIQAPVVEQPDSLCQGVLRELGRHNYHGVLLDFEQAPTPDRQILVSQLDTVLQQHQKALYLPPAYAPHSKQATILVNTAVSGGNFRQYLETCKTQYGNIALDVQRLQMDFILPATTGEGTSINAEVLTSLRKKYGSTTFFSHELCTRYFTYQQEGQTHFILYDDGETMLQKLRIGESIGVKIGFCVYHEVEDLLGVLFGKR
ncbi:hypothetical protein RFF05_17020 [Bengtsoniella intestinalis]|uniref:hypothetical protein n=1 Tax=Bengtsoniella intestinalis TaxID=3073143 RepID=UPI00391F99ED